MRIAIDAHGGDHAPGEIVKGALQAASQLEDVEILLVGIEEEIQAEIDGDSPTPENVSIVPASEKIGMGESPVSAFMKKKDSSIGVAIKLVKNGDADAIISAGNTGAVVGGATLLLKPLPGVKRAGIAVPYFTEKKMATLIDAGANINCRPLHLFQYAQMAHIFQQEVFGIENPKIGLMNIGEEDKKGSQLIQEAHQLLRKSKLNFIGNVEGQELSRGHCDIIVCDGFVGNVVLKVSEGIATSMLRIFQRELKELGADDEKVFQKALGKVKNAIDYAEYGGAPLLGINGVCLICHGRSNARAIANAVKTAAKFDHHHINDKIRQTIKETEVTL